MIVMIMFVSVFALSKLMRGVSSQLEYSDAHLRALTIAESAYQMLVAQMMSKNWEERWFADKPQGQAGTDFEGGTYDYFIQNTPGVEKSADIWIRAEYKNTRRVLFYRIKYQDRIFKGLTTPQTDFTSTVDDQKYVPLIAPAVDPMTAQINELINIRKQNRVKSTQIWEVMSQKVDPYAILTSLGASVPGGELPITSVPVPGGGSTAVSPPPKNPAPAGGSSNVPNVEDPKKLLEWIEAHFGYYAQNKFKNQAKKVFQEVEDLVKAHKYIQAEQKYKDFLQSLYGIENELNDALAQEKIRFDAAVAAAGGDATLIAQITADHAARVQAITDSLVVFK
jgi:hypothetical protein